MIAQLRVVFLLQSGRWWRPVLVALCLLLSLGPTVRAAASAGARLPVLDTPALHSRLATRAAMLAVTRAGRRLVAVGERGIVLWSDDDGHRWHQAQRVPASVSLTAVQFVTSRIGWAVGHFGVVLRTDDGGQTWTKQLDGIRAAQLALDAAQQRIRQATSVTVELKRQLADAERLVHDGPDKPFLSLYFRDSQHGLVVGAFGLAFETSDGGRHWVPWMSHLADPFGYHLYGIAPLDADTLLIAGEQGTLLRSTDGGQRFVALPKPDPGSWFGLLTTPDHTVLLFGLIGTVYRSEDQGTHWQRSDSGTDASISAGTVLRNGDIVLTTVSGDVLISRDDGRNFQRLGSLGAPLTGIVQASDGRLVVSSMRGVRELSQVLDGAARDED